MKPALAGHDPPRPASRAYMAREPLKQAQV